MPDTPIALPLLWQATASASLVLAAIALFLWRFSGRPWGLLVCLACLVVDQAAKGLAILLLPAEAVRVLWGAVYLNLMLNPYQGFGSTFSELLLASLAGLALGLVLYVRLERLQYRMSLVLELACGLVMGGLAGILVDRVRAGGVIDFLQFGPRGLYVYNLADLFAAAGMLLLAARGLVMLVEFGRHPVGQPVDLPPSPDALPPAG